MTQALNLANFANNLNTSGATTNAGLQNSSVTVTAGTGMSGGGAVALGSSVTLTNAGVTSVTGAGTVSVSASTGSVTITGTGGSGSVTSVATGNGLTGGTITSSGTISLDYYTGTTRLNSSFPIGTYLMMFDGNAGDPNSNVPNMRINNSYANYQNAVGGATAMAGTWRWRGYGARDGCGNLTGSSLVQRVS